MDAVKNQIKRLRVDALYGKKKHFNAAERKASLSGWLQIPALIINAVLASVLFGNIQKETPEAAKWTSAILAVIATILNALIAYWKLAKQVEGHRRVGTKFLKVAKGCERLLAAETDGATKENLVESLEKWAATYDEANSEAEAYPTSRGDFEKAKKGIEAGEETYLAGELEL